MTHDTLEQKLEDNRFQGDIASLLRAGIRYNPAEAHALIARVLLPLL